MAICAARWAPDPVLSRVPKNSTVFRGEITPFITVGGIPPCGVDQLPLFSYGRDKLINLIVVFYISIVRIPVIKGGMSLSRKKRDF